MTTATKEEKPKMALYEIAEELKRLDAILEATGGALPEGDAGATLEAWLQKFEFMEAAKVDNYAHYWRNLEAEKKACEEEAARFNERAAVAANKLKRIKEMAMLAMQIRGKDQLAGTLFKLARQKNGGKVPVEIMEPYLADPSKLPGTFKIAHWVADTESIRAELAANPTGVLASCARLGEVGYHVRLR